MSGGLGHLYVDRACGRVDPLGPGAVGIALTLRCALVKSGAEKALALDLHRQFEGPGEHRGDLAWPMLNQLFQDCLKGRILRLSICSSPGLGCSSMEYQNGQPLPGLMARTSSEFPDLRLQ